MESLQKYVIDHHQKTIAECSNEELYIALLNYTKPASAQKKLNTGKKKVYYISAEFLIGKLLSNNLINLGLYDDVKKELSDAGKDLIEVEEVELEPSLGNGGLGRLAACFMDSLASLDLAGHGNCIRYRYGLFKQKIVDGWQMELPDIWLPGGEAWLAQRTDLTFKVKFDGYVKERWTEKGLVIDHVDAKEVEAVAYDMMVSGKDSEAVSVLRLWRTQNVHDFDMKSFSQGDYMRAMQDDSEAELISKVLYPSDNHFEGKSLRLKQQYLRLCRISSKTICAVTVRSIRCPTRRRSTSTIRTLRSVFPNSCGC